MMTKFCLSLLIILFLLISNGSSTGGNRKNVLLIVVDDLRPVLGCYGDKAAITPNMDSLASVSTVYTSAYAQQAVCAPSRNSFLTSRRPDTTKLYDFGSYWRDMAGNFTTLPQYFTEHGYDTYSIGKIFHPGIAANFSDDMPYSWSSTPFHPSSQKYANWPVCPVKGDFLRRMNLLCPVDVSEQPEKTLPDIQSRDEAIRFIKSQSHQDPFFLAVGFHKPHVPFKFPKEYLDLFPLADIPAIEYPKRPLLMPDIAWNPYRRLRIREDVAALDVPFPYGPMPSNFSLRIKQHYYAATTYTDNQIGLVLQALVENGFGDDTIVALLGDHGWSLGEHQEWAKFGNFEVDTRVPFIIHDPRKNDLSTFEYTDPLGKHSNFQEEISLNKSDFIRYPVELLDLFPTLVDLAKLPLIPTCPKSRKKTSIVQLCTEGKSLVRIKNSKLPKLAFSQYPRPSVEPQNDSDRPNLRDIRYMGYSVRSRRYRYTEWVGFDHKKTEADWRNVVAVELYDHNVDPGEMDNRASSLMYWNVQQKLKNILRRKMKRLDLSEEDYDIDSISPTPFDWAMMRFWYILTNQHPRVKRTTMKKMMNSSWDFS